MEEKDFEILQKIAANYPEESDEHKTLLKAARSLEYLAGKNLEKDFRRYIENLKKPPGALDLVYAKLCGIELSPELSNERIADIDKDINQLVEKLKLYNESIKWKRV